MRNNVYTSKYSGRGIDDILDLSVSHTKEIDGIKVALKDVEAVAKGRASGYVFDTVDDMNAWLANPDNVAKLTLGDNFYIRDTSVPDYWWDTETQTAQELETQKVELDEYVKAEEGKGLSTNDLTDIKDAVLKDILTGRLVLDNGDGRKLSICFDEIFAEGDTLDINLSGGELQGCTTANIEVLHYLDMNTSKFVNLQEVIDSKASKEEVDSLQDAIDIRATKEEVDSLNTSIRMTSGGRETLSFLDIHNTETRGSYPIDELTIDIPDGEYPEQFIAGLVFSSGETAPTVIYPANNRILQWVGTDCSSTDEYSVFIPTSNKNYDIVFYFNGTHFVGLVNGYETVTSNTEV